ncbi:MAG: ORF6N domain-containing protein [Lentimicrobium sp.]
MDIIKHIEEKIININDQMVLIDSDVAAFYEVETKRINEAVKNNPEKFPAGYIIDISESEWASLKTKFSTSIRGGKTKPACRRQVAESLY